MNEVRAMLVSGKYDYDVCTFSSASLDAIKHHLDGRVYLEVYTKPTEIPIHVRYQEGKRFMSTGPLTPTLGAGAEVIGSTQRGYMSYKRANEQTVNVAGYTTRIIQIHTFNPSNKKWAELEKVLPYVREGWTTQKTYEACTFEGTKECLW